MSHTSELFKAAAANHGVFGRGSAREHRVSDKQLRRLVSINELDQFSSNVFTLPGVGDPALKPMVAATTAIPGSAVAARSTCHLYGIGDLSTSTVDLWVPERAARKSLDGVRQVRNGALNPRSETVRKLGIPTVSPAVALTQVGACADDDAVEHCIDDFLRSYDEKWLRETLEKFGRSGRPGIGALRRVLNAPHRVQGVTDSWMERLLANVAAQPGLPPVNLQYEVTFAGRTYRVDVAYPSIRLGLEAHSRQFHFGPSKEDADNVRDQDFAAVGWQLLYLTWHQLQDPVGFAEQFGAIARRRAQDLGVAW